MNIDQRIKLFQLMLSFQLPEMSNIVRKDGEVVRYFMIDAEPDNDRQANARHWIGAFNQRTAVELHRCVDRLVDKSNRRICIEVGSEPTSDNK